MSSPFLAAHQPEKPKVSVVITTYNRSAIVPIAIESVLRQSYADYELIVIDDGSTDDTRERLQAYGANIRYFYQANRGVSAARNTGVGLARGEWVSILDSDDVWDPTKLERQLEVLAALGNEYGACITNCKYVGDPAWSATVFQENGLKTDSMSGPLNDPMKYILKNGYGTCVQSLLVLRSVIDKAGGFDEALGLAEDRDLMFRLTFRTRFCYVSAPLVSIDRTPRVSRLTDLCSKRDDDICAWGELLRKKMLAHPEFVDPGERRLIQDELIGLYYDWAAAKARNLRLADTMKNLNKIRQMGQSYRLIFWTMLSRVGKKLLRIFRPRTDESQMWRDSKITEKAG